MAENINSDPLGIIQLTNELKLSQKRMDDLERLIASNLDLPIAEALLIEKTGIKAGTLRKLRNAGEIRSYKAGNVVMYTPSEFRKDIMKIGAV